MRRLAVLALVSAFATASLLVVGTMPASAHICPVAVEIPVAASSTIDVGVTVEGGAVPDVEIDVPAGLTLDRVDAKAGWTVTRTGSTLRYHGGPIAAFTCEYFPLVVTAPSRGSFGVTVVQRDAAGTVVARSVPDPNSTASRVLDQYVYAGVKPPKAPSSSKGLSTATLAGIALIGVGVVVFSALVVRDRRRRRDVVDDDRVDDDGDEHGEGRSDARAREEELRARVEQFRARKPGPRPPG